MSVELEGTTKVLTDHISFAVSPGMKKAIRKAARREGIARSVWIRRACAQRLTEPPQGRERRNTNE